MLKITTTEIVIHNQSDESMLQDTTTVNLVDEGGGNFITITQYDETHNPIIVRLNPTEIPMLFKTINFMLNQKNEYVP